MALPKVSSIPKWLIAGVIAIALAISVMGGIWFFTRNDRANAEIAEYEKEVAELNARLVERQSEVTQNVVREYHTKVIERERIVNQNASTIASSVPDNGKLSRGWVYTHNQIATGQIVDPQLASDSEPSNASGTDALQVVNINYDIAKDTADRLTALQKWLREQEKVSEETTAAK